MYEPKQRINLSKPSSPITSIRRFVRAVLQVILSLEIKSENREGGMMKQQSKPKQHQEKDESRKWKLRKGNILVVEDAQTASLVIVARGLKDLSEKITVLKEVLVKFEAQLAHP